MMLLNLKKRQLIIKKFRVFMFLNFEWFKIKNILEITEWVGCMEKNLFSV